MAQISFRKNSLQVWTFSRGRARGRVEDGGEVSGKARAGPRTQPQARLATPRAAGAARSRAGDGHHRGARVASAVVSPEDRKALLFGLRAKPVSDPGNEHTWFTPNSTAQQSALRASARLGPETVTGWRPRHRHWPHSGDSGPGPRRYA